jgi:tRNA(Phe) wybutosine-synthesizing methylase Tyw3
VPLLHLEIKEATEMEVEVTYTGAFLADKQYLCYLTMQQYKYTYHERDEMKWEVVI